MLNKPTPNPIVSFYTLQIRKPNVITSKTSLVAYIKIKRVLVLGDTIACKEPTEIGLHDVFSI